MHRGGVNAARVLDWVFREIVSPPKVLVTGCSAGSHASWMWTPYVIQKYPAAKVVQMGDSQAGVIDPSWMWNVQGTWNASGSFPSWVTGLDPKTAGASEAQIQSTVASWNVTYGYERIAKFYPTSTFSQFNWAIDLSQIAYYTLTGGASTKWATKMSTSLSTLRNDTSNFLSYTAPAKGRGKHRDQQG